jgi:hypothetical protein
MSSYDVLGQQVAMPVLVRDASAGTAIFEVDAGAAQALVGDAFEVVQTSPGRSNLVLALVDYRDNDLGDYLEIGVTFFVTPKAGGEPGTFIYKLPVDQEFTCAAGRGIWGFPKTVEALSFDYSDTTLLASLAMDDELVLAVQIPRGGADASPELAMTTYTYKDGAPHATRFVQGGTGNGMSVDPAAIVLTLGTHPLAKEIEGLGPVPLMATWTEHMQARFEEAVRL